MGDEENGTQTQTQNSQVDWSQPTAPSIPIPNIWGRLYSIAGKHCWRSTGQQTPEYYGKNLLRIKIVCRITNKIIVTYLRCLS